MEMEKDLFYHYTCTCFCTCAPHSVILSASGAGIQAVLPDPITVTARGRCFFPCSLTCKRQGGGIRSRVALRAPRRDLPGSRVSGTLRLGAAWRSWELGAARGASGQQVSLRRRARQCAARRRRAPRPAVALPRVPAAAVSHGGQVQSACPSPACPAWRAASEGLCAPALVWVPARGAARVPGLCSPPPLAMGHSVHWAPGYCLGLRPRSSLRPLSPSSWEVTGCGGTGGGGGRQGGLACPTSQCSPLSSAARGAWRWWARGAASRVSGQRVGRGLHFRAHPCVACRLRVPTWQYPFPRAHGRCGPPQSG